MSSAPSSSRPCARSGLRATAVTRAPARLASWTAKRPTPPEAPVTSARRPRSDGGPSSIAYSAVSPATGRVAAWASVTASGRAARVRVGTATFCAQAPSWTSPTTRVPACGPLPSRAARSTTPATSQPVTVPGGWVGRRLTSPRLSETARTATSASPGAGSASATSVSSTWGAWSQVVRASTGATYTAGAGCSRCQNGGPMDPHAHPGPVASALAGRRQAWEAERLSPLAARSWPARRRVAEDDCGLRSPLQRDRDRIVHCKAFRRLKHKTQVFVAPEGDHFRTRLTHTIEVTQISRTVARALDLNEDLVEAIGLGHDLGHPPFGHIGEAVLDRCLAERYGGGLRHYEPSLRVVDILEPAPRAVADGDQAPVGLNLCEDVRDGILCHSGRAPMPRTLEGRIVRLVDRVAYLNHDIDDAIRAGVLREDELPPRPIAVLGETGSRRVDPPLHDPAATSAAAREHRPGH